MPWFGLDAYDAGGVPFTGLPPCASSVQEQTAESG